MSDLRDLLALAAEALKPGQEIIGQISKIEEYCGVFDSLSEGLTPGSGGSSPEDLELLREKHEQIMNLAAGMHARTAEQIKNYRQKARRVLSYDTSGAAGLIPRKGRRG